MKKVNLLLLLLFYMNNSFSQRLQSVTIIYSDFMIESPVAIYPVWFDNGAFENFRDTITTTDSVLIYRLKQAIECLPKFRDNSRVDTRGKISFSFEKGNNWEGYFDLFCLQLKYEDKTYRLTKDIRLAMNAIAARNKKRPVFDRESMNVKY